MTKMIAAARSRAGVIAFTVLLPITFCALLALSWKLYDIRRTPILESKHQTQQVFDRFAGLPLHFEAAPRRQAGEPLFWARGTDYLVTISPNYIDFHFSNSGDKTTTPLDRSHLRMQFCPSRPAQLTGQDQLPGTSSYFIGNNPHAWRTQVNQYGKVKLGDVYKGTDLVFYGNQRNLEFDCIVAAGADPGDIAFTFADADRITLDDNHCLHVVQGQHELRLRAPTMYQWQGTQRLAVAGNYNIQGNHIGFSVREHNPQLALVIDPVVEFVTYLGGSENEEAYGIAVDDAGDLYVTGNTSSLDFPVLNGVQGQRNAGDDVFVCKIKGDGSALLYSTYIGGAAADYGRSIAVDDQGNAYVTGTTSSYNKSTTPENEAFPTVNAFQESPLNGSRCAFVLKLGAAGTSLLYSTYFGNGDRDQIGSDIAVDAARQCYILGTTFSSGITTRNAFMPLSPSYYFQYFVAKFAPAATGDASLVYSTYLGGNDDSGWDWDTGAIAVTADGEAVITGRTQATNYPVVNSFQSARIGSQDAVITKLARDGSSLVFSTYLGGDATDEGQDIAIDSLGNIYVTGSASNQGFPVTAGTYQQGPYHSFISKFSAAGQLLWSGRAGYGKLAVDNKESVHVLDKYRSTIIKMNRDGTAPEWSSVITETVGASYAESVHWQTMCLNKDGDVFLAGYKGSGPIQPVNALQPVSKGKGEIVLAKLAMSMSMVPDGVAYDTENWDKHTAELQSTFSGLVINGSGLANVTQVIFRRNGVDDVYMIPDHIQASDTEVRFDLVVAHAATVGERDVVLKTELGAEIDVTAAVGRKFIVTRVRTMYNQAVDQNLLTGIAYREILIANKRGVVRLALDDEAMYGHTFTGTLRIRGIPGDSASLAPFEFRDTYSEADIIAGRDYMFLPFPGPPAAGDHLLTVTLKRQDDRLILCPDIRRTFTPTASINIYALRKFIRFRANGAVLPAPVETVTAADVAAAIDYMRKVYPIEADKIHLRDGGRTALEPKYGAFAKNLAGTTVYTLPQARHGDLVLELNQELSNINAREGAGGTVFNIMAVFLPANCLFEDTNFDGDLNDPEDFFTAGLTYMGTNTVLITPTYNAAGRPINLGCVLAHEVGHRIADVALSTSPLPVLGDNLGDEYNRGQFFCGVNPPISGNRDFAGRISCQNSPFVFGVTGDSSAIYSHRSAFDPWARQPRLTYIGAEASAVLFSFMGNSRAEANTWISLTCYEEITKCLAPQAGVQALARIHTATNTEEIIQVSGIVYEDGRAILNPLTKSASGVTSPPGNGPYRIDVLDAAGHPLSGCNFEAEYMLHSDPPIKTDHAFFSVRLGYASAAKKITLSKQGVMLASQTLSDHAPVIKIESPKPGETIQKYTRVQWSASDADHDALTFSLYYNTDQDALAPIATSLTGTAYDLDTGIFDQTPGKLVLMATDGYNRTWDSVDDITVGVNMPDDGRNQPDDFWLGQNYPNPFNSGTTIQLSIPPAEQTPWRLEIYDVQGRLVRNLVTQPQSLGSHNVVWDGADDAGQDVPSGIYFCRLRAGAQSQVRKMIKLE